MRGDAAHPTRPRSSAPSSSGGGSMPSTSGSGRSRGGGPHQRPPLPFVVVAGRRSGCVRAVPRPLWPPPSPSTPRRCGPAGLVAAGTMGGWAHESRGGGATAGAGTHTRGGFLQKVCLPLCVGDDAHTHRPAPRCSNTLNGGCGRRWRAPAAQGGIAWWEGRWVGPGHRPADWGAHERRRAEPDT